MQPFCPVSPRLPAEYFLTPPTDCSGGLTRPLPDFWCDRGHSISVQAGCAGFVRCWQRIAAKRGFAGFIGFSPRPFFPPRHWRQKTRSTTPRGFGSVLQAPAKHSRKYAHATSRIDLSRPFLACCNAASRPLSFTPSDAMTTKPPVFLPDKRSHVLNRAQLSSGLLVVLPATYMLRCPIIRRPVREQDAGKIMSRLNLSPPARTASAAMTMQALRRVVQQQPDNQCPALRASPVAGRFRRRPARFPAQPMPAIWLFPGRRFRSVPFGHGHYPFLPVHSSPFPSQAGFCPARRMTRHRSQTMKATAACAVLYRHRRMPGRRRSDQTTPTDAAARAQALCVQWQMWPPAHRAARQWLQPQAGACACSALEPRHATMPATMTDGGGRIRRQHHVAAVQREISAGLSGWRAALDSTSPGVATAAPAQARKAYRESGRDLCGVWPTAAPSVG